MKNSEETCPFLVCACETCNLISTAVKHDSIWFILKIDRSPVFGTAHVDVCCHPEIRGRILGNQVPDIVKFGNTSDEIRVTFASLAGKHPLPPEIGGGHLYKVALV